MKHVKDNPNKYTIGTKYNCNRFNQGPPDRRGCLYFPKMLFSFGNVFTHSIWVLFVTFGKKSIPRFFTHFSRLGGQNMAVWG